MISLQDRIMGHPISDPAYMAHLRTADVFNECQEARIAEAAALAAVNTAIIEHDKAVKRKEAAVAKAKLMESMEGWD